MEDVTRTWFPECVEVVRQLWEYLDGRARPESVASIEDHMAQCRGCRAIAEAETELLRSLSKLRGQHSDPQRLREDVLKVLEAAGLGEAPEP